MTIEKWKEKNKYAKGYAHFDNKVSLKQVWQYISNPNNVKKHSFYPFIHYTQEFNKYRHGKIKPKTREICYSAHIDRYIYSYYGHIINEYYNKRAVEDKINDVAIAYRNNLKKNNIHFAKKAIDFIRKLEDCYIVVGDFTGFFDNLNHNYLKSMLCDLLHVKRLSDDYYAVYKNITKYSTWELKNILQYYNLENSTKGIKTLNEKAVLFTIDEFRRIKKQDERNAKPNSNCYGIPQGSAISAVLSNVYMLEADKKINDAINMWSGLYMRYSDDIIIILPKVTENLFIDQFTCVNKILKSIPGLKLQREKTQIYKYCKTELTNCNELVMKEVQNGQNRINYLGFTFDGEKVTIRDKTITKYYYRMYRKLKTIVKNNGVTKKGKRISAKNVYMKYSIKGAHPINKEGKKVFKGNFITYVERAKAIWGDNEPITISTRRHMIKIRRQLDKIK